MQAGASVTAGDFNGLRKLRELTGARFIRGIILYTGAAAVPFSEGMWALPVQLLWRGMT